MFCCLSFLILTLWQQYTVNLLTANILYKRQFSNYRGKASIQGRQRTLGSRFTSSIRSDLSIADRPNIWYYKTILPQETYVLFEVIIYALFLLLFNFCQSRFQPLSELFRPIKTKPCRNFKSITTTTFHMFSSDFRFQVTMWKRERYNGTTFEMFCGV